MKSSEDLGLLLKVAKLYYADGMSKTDISHEIRQSTTQVARLLQWALERKIVRIDFYPPLLEGLAANLVSKYPCLREAFVVPFTPDPTFQTDLIAKQGAEYFEVAVVPKSKVALSGGVTVFEMVKTLPERDRNIKLYPTTVLGRGHTIVRHIDPIVSLNLLWTKSGYKEDGIFFVTVTPLEKQQTFEDIRNYNKELLNRFKVRKLVDEIKTVDFVFASIGPIALPVDIRKQVGALGVDLLADVGITEKQMRAEGAIGDLAYCFLDKDGNCKKEWEMLFLGLSLENYRQMAADPKKRVVLMAGRHKDDPLRAALKGRLINVLITDETTAKTLLADG